MEFNHLDGTALRRLQEELRSLQGSRLIATKNDHRAKMRSIFESVVTLGLQEPQAAFSLAIQILQMTPQKTSGLFSEIMSMVEKVVPLGEEDSMRVPLLTELLKSRRFSVDEHGHVLAQMMDAVIHPGNNIYAVGNFLSKAYAETKSFKELPLSDAGENRDILGQSFHRFLERALKESEDKKGLFNSNQLRQHMQLWIQQAPALAKYIVPQADQLQSSSAPAPFVP